MDRPSSRFRPRDEGSGVLTKSSSLCRRYPRAHALVEFYFKESWGVADSRAPYVQASLEACLQTIGDSLGGQLQKILQSLIGITPEARPLQGVQSLNSELDIFADDFHPPSPPVKFDEPNTKSINTINPHYANLALIQPVIRSALDSLRSTKMAATSGDISAEITASSSLIFDRVTRVCERVKRMSQTIDLLVEPFTIVHCPETRVRCAFIIVIKCQGALTITVVDPSADSECFRETYDSIIQRLSPYTHWVVEEPNKLEHSAFWTMLFALGHVANTKNTASLYTVILPFVGKRIYCPDFVSAVQYKPQLPRTSDWVLSVILCSAISCHLLDPTSTTVCEVKHFDISAAAMLCVWKTLVNDWLEMYKADNDKYLKEDLLQIRTYISRDICAQSRTWKSPKAIKIAQELCRSIYYEVTTQRELSTAGEITALELSGTCSLPLFGMLTNYRMTCFSDGPRNFVGGLTSRPDLTTPQQWKNKIKCGSDLAQALQTLMETLANIEYQRRSIKHGIWLGWCIVEDFVVRVLPMKYIASPPTLHRADQMSIMRSLLDLLRYVCVTYIRIVNAMRSEALIGFEYAKIMIAASTFQLLDSVSRMIPEDNVGSWTLAYDPDFAIQLNGLDDLTALLPCTNPGLLALRTTILDVIRSHHECKEVFAFDLLGPSFGINELKLWEKACTVIGVSERIGGKRMDVLLNEDQHLHQLIPEWLLFRDATFIAKFVINCKPNSPAIMGMSATMTQAKPLWKWVKCEGLLQHFRWTFLNKAGRVITNCVAAKTSSSSPNVVKLPFVTTREGICAFGDVHKAYTNESARQQGLIEKLRTEAGVDSAGASLIPTALSTFGAFSKYITGFWDNRDDDESQLSNLVTSLIPGTLLSDGHALGVTSSLAVDQSGHEISWQPITGYKLASLRGETDVLNMKSLPVVHKSLPPWDLELLLELLASPYIRIPSLLAFFLQPGDHLLALASPTVQYLIWWAIFEVGPWKSAGLLNRERETLMLDTNICSEVDEDYQTKALLGTRMGLLMNELIYNGENIIGSLSALLRHCYDKETGKMDLTSNAPLLALGFTVQVAIKVLGFLSLIIDTPDLVAEQWASLPPHCSSPMETRKYGERLYDRLAKPLVAEIAPALQKWALEASVRKRVLFSVFSHSLLLLILAECDRCGSRRQLTQCGESLFFVLAHRPFKHTEATFEHSNGYDDDLSATRAAEVTSDAEDDAASGANTSNPSQPYTQRETIAEIRQCAIYGVNPLEIFGTMNRLRLNFLGLCEDQAPKPWLNASVLSHASTTLPENEPLAENIPETNQASRITDIRLSRQLFCDSVLKVVVGGSCDPDITQDPPTALWEKSSETSAGAPSPFRGLSGCYWGRYVRKGGGSETAVEIDFQLGEISFLQKGFQILGDWAYEFEDFRDVIVASVTSKQQSSPREVQNTKLSITSDDHKRSPSLPSVSSELGSNLEQIGTGSSIASNATTKPIFHCATLTQSNTMLHVRLIGLLEFDIIRMCAMNGPIVKVDLLDRLLSTREQERKDVMRQIQSLKELSDSLAAAKKKNLDAAQRKEYKRLLLELERLDQPLTTEDVLTKSSWTPGSLMSLLWNPQPTDPNLFVAWKSKSLFKDVPFYKIPTSAKESARLIRFLAFIDWCGRDSFVALPPNRPIRPDHCREIVYHHVSLEIQIFVLVPIGLRLIRKCVYTSAANHSFGLLESPCITEYQRIDSRIARGSPTNLFFGAGTECDQMITISGQPLQRQITSPDSLLILRPRAAEDIQDTFSEMLSAVPKLQSHESKRHNRLSSLESRSPPYNDNVRDHTAVRDTVDSMGMICQAYTWCKAHGLQSEQYLPKKAVEGILPLNMLREFDLWQPLHVFTASLPTVTHALRNTTSSNFKNILSLSRGAQTALIHLVQSRNFCNLLNMMCDPLSTMRLTPTTGRRSSSSAYCYIVPPPLTRHKCEWRSQVSSPKSCWSDFDPSSFGLLLNELLSQPNDGTAFIQRPSGSRGNEVLTLIDSRTLKSRGISCLQMLQRFDDIANLRLWTLGMPNLNSVRRRILADIFNKLSSALEDIASPPASPTKTSTGSNCQLCQSLYVIYEYFYDEITREVIERAQIEQPIDLIEVPDLGLTFRSSRLINLQNNDQIELSSNRLYCDQHNGYYLARCTDGLILNTVGSLREQSVILQRDSGELQLLISGKCLPWVVGPAKTFLPRPPLTVPFAKESVNSGLELLGKINVGSVVLPHLTFQIHNSRCFLYSSEGRNLLALFLMRLTRGEYASASELLHNGAFLQHARYSLNTNNMYDRALWAALDAATEINDLSNPDGVGCRLRLLLSLGAFGNPAKISETQSGPEDSLSTRLIAKATELRVTAMRAAQSALASNQVLSQAINNLSPGRVAQLPNWDGVTLYETYSKQIQLISEVCRLSLAEERFVCAALDRFGVSLSPAAVIRRAVTLATSKTRNDVLDDLGADPLILTIGKHFQQCRCAFDDVDVSKSLKLDSGQSQTLLKSISLALGDTIQSLKGMVMTYTRPTNALAGKDAVAWMLTNLTYRLSSWSDVITPDNLASQELSLARDFLFLYDFLSNGVNFTIVENEGTYLWGCMLVRMISKNDLRLPSKLAGILKYMTSNYAFATTVAPKYVINFGENIPSARDNDGSNRAPSTSSSGDRTSRLQYVTDKLGVTLKFDKGFQNLLEELDNLLNHGAPNINAMTTPAAVSPPVACTRAETRVPVSEWSIVGHWGVDPRSMQNFRLAEANREPGSFRRTLHLEGQRKVSRTIKTVSDVKAPLMYHAKRLLEMPLPQIQTNSHHESDSIVFDESTVGEKFIDQLRKDLVVWHDMQRAERVQNQNSAAWNPEQLKLVLQDIMTQVNDLLTAERIVIEESTKKVTEKIAAIGGDENAVDRLCGVKRTVTFEQLAELLQHPAGVDVIRLLLAVRSEQANTTVTELMNDCAALVFMIGRRGHFSTAISCLQTVIGLLGRPSDYGRMCCALQRLISLLAHQSEYIHAEGTQPSCSCGAQVKSVTDDIFAPSALQQLTRPKSPESTVLCYSPHLLLYEFANNLRLRSNQVRTINTMCKAIIEKKPLCIQLMMGQGKTTVIAPLLASMCAGAQTLVLLVVPQNLVDFSRRSLELRYAAILKRPVYALNFNRYVALNTDILEDLRHIRDMRGVVVCSPTTVKSVYLKFILLLAIAWRESFIMRTSCHDDAYSAWQAHRKRRLRTMKSLMSAVSSGSKLLHTHVLAPVGTLPSRAVKSYNKRTLFSDLKSVVGKVTKPRTTKTNNKSQSSSNLGGIAHQLNLLKKLKSNAAVPEGILRREIGLVHSELVVAYQIIALFQTSILLLDEVDQVLHPQKSELRWPVGDPTPLDLTLPITVPLTAGPANSRLQGAEFAEERLLAGLKDIEGARWVIAWHFCELLFAVNRKLIEAIVTRGTLNAINSEHTCVCWPETRGLGNVVIDAERVQIIEAFSDKLLELIKEQSVIINPHLILLSPHKYAVLKPIIARWMALLFYQLRIPSVLHAQLPAILTGAADDDLIHRIDTGAVQRKEVIQLLVLARQWVKYTGKHVLSKIHRVHYGLLATAASARVDEISFSTARQFLAVPFIGKDTPSENSEFANIDCLIGFTIISYRLNGLRLFDVDLCVLNLKTQLRIEQQRQPVRESDEEQLPSVATYIQWVQSSGGRVRGVHTMVNLVQDAETPTMISPESDEIISVLPLDVLDPADSSHMEPLRKLIKWSPAAVYYYLCQIIFPCTLRSSPYQLVASGHHLGSNTIFRVKIGFSGTPNSLLPPEFGECHFEKGTDGQMLAMLISPEVSSVELLPLVWSPALLLRLCAENKLNALIDVGALVTGYNNEEAARLLLESLDPSMVGVCYFAADDERKIMLRQTAYTSGGQNSVISLESTDITPDRRFTFYDQTHAVGQDVSQDPMAVAYLTVGKDTTFRDLAQGAWRLRQLGQGQKIILLVPPQISQKANSKRMLWKHSLGSAPTQLERIVNFALHNSLNLQKSLGILSVKQSAEHLIGSLFIEPVLRSPIEELLHSQAPIGIDGMIERLLVEGNRNTVESTLSPTYITWLERVRVLLQDGKVLMDSPLILRSDLNTALKWALIQKEVAILETRSAGLSTTLSTKELNHSIASDVADMQVKKAFTNALIKFVDVDSSSESMESFGGSDNEFQMDAEVEAEAEEEMEEEEEQEEEIEKEEEQQVVCQDVRFTTSLKYSKLRRETCPWNFRRLSEWLTHQVGNGAPVQDCPFRRLRECGIYLKSASSPLYMPFPRGIWATQNFHLPDLDSSTKRLRNAIFFLEIILEASSTQSPASKTHIEANNEHMVAVQVLFLHLRESQSAQFITEQSVWSLMYLLGLIDDYNGPLASGGDTAENKLYLKCLQRIAQTHNQSRSGTWTVNELVNFLFHDFNVADLMSKRTDVNHLPKSSIYGMNSKHFVILLTMREAEKVRALLHRVSHDPSILLKHYGFRIALRSTLDKNRALDVSNLAMTDDRLSLQRALYSTCIKILNGQIVFTGRDVKLAQSVTKNLNDSVLLAWLQENGARRRRVTLTEAACAPLRPAESGESIWQRQIGVNPQDTARGIATVRRLMAGVAASRSLSVQSIMRELTTLQNRTTATLKDGGDLLEGILDTQSVVTVNTVVTVGTLMVWLKLNGVDYVNITDIQGIAIALNTHFNGTAVTAAALQKLIE